MLINQELFDTVEQALSKNGTIEDFENENGKITGRMMITLTDIPEKTKSIQQWYLADGSLKFVFGVNVSERDFEKGYVIIKKGKKVFHKIIK